MSGHGDEEPSVAEPHLEAGGGCGPGRPDRPDRRGRRGRRAAGVLPATPSSAASWPLSAPSRRWRTCSLARPRASVEALVAERLEQVVERPRVEGPQRVLVEGGDEDDHRHAGDADLAHHREAVHLGHLHVEQHEVGRVRADRRDGLASVRALAHQRDVGIVVQQPAHPRAGQRLVVDDERAHGDRRMGGHALPAAASDRHGSSTRTTAPPCAPACRWSRAAPPYSRSRRARVLARPSPAAPDVAVAARPAPSSATSS
jgi:hypothetical protein